MKVLLIDDHKLFGKSIESVMSKQPEITTFKHVAYPSFAEKMLLAFEPSLILMDIQMGKVNGLELTAELLNKYPALKIIMLSGHNIQAYRTRAQNVGAYGFLDKNIEIEVLMNALLRVHYDNEKVFPKIFTDSELPVPLTNQELTILKMISRGEKQLTVARELGVSERTIQNQLGSIFKKLETHSVVSSVMRAIEMGLIPIEFM